MRTTDLRAGRKERGTQVVELAIVLPLLSILAFIVIEGAAFIRVHQVLNNAAREGARVSAERNNEGAAGQTAARQAALDYVNTYAATSCPNLDAQVVQDLSMPNAGTGVALTGSQVTVSCQYTLKFLPAFLSGVGGTIPLSGRAVFRNLY